MQAKTFRGGVHLQYHKEATASKAIVQMPEPSRVVLPIQQHIGAPAEVCVEVGEQVKLGQMIAKPGGFVSAPIHASISGKVTAIAPAPHSSGRDVMSIIIENDGSGATDFAAVKDLKDYTVEELKNLMQQIGLVGMGGAGFPTHVKYSPSEGKKLQCIILNGAECEPYLTCDHRLMLEQADLVVFGLQAMMKAAGVEEGYIGVEVNKLDAIAKLSQVAAVDPRIQIVPLEVKYPQGEEKMLINSVTGKVIPLGGLPADVGVVVNNIATAVTFAKAIKEGKPLIERVVTVTGAVNEPQNICVRLGTPVSELIDFCGGFSGTLGRVVLGGPMTGPAQYRLDIPVVKNTSGVLAQDRGMLKLLESSPCVRCARCVDVCPYNLMPCMIASAIEHKDLAEAERVGILDCRECGSCTFVCPSQRPIVQRIKKAKGDIMAARRKAAAAAKK